MSPWKKLGGQGGLGLCLVGLILVFLGWNGAASLDRVPGQFPYLISGGIAGLCLVIIGAALLVVQNAREERALLLSALAEVREGVERMAMGSSATIDGSGSAVLAAQAEAAGLVAAGPSTYHRPSCKLLEGRGALPTVTVEEAESRGLEPCRACDAATMALPRATSDGDSRMPRRGASSRRRTRTSS